MSKQADTLEITIHHKRGDTWPISVEWRRSGIVGAVRWEDAFCLDEEQQTRLLALLFDPLAYGTILGKALFAGKDGNVRDAFKEAQGASPERLRVLLHIEDEELKRLHWERLCYRVRGSKWRFLALDQRLPFSLYLPATTGRTFPAIDQRDLKVLLLVVSPQGLDLYKLDEFEVEPTVASIRRSLGEIDCDVLGRVPDAVGPPTLDALCEQLTREHYTLLHVVAHGNAGKEDTVLYLADENNRVKPVPGEELITRLDDIQGAGGLPHFCFLATCESAKPEADAGLGGLAQRMVRELGLPAVLAMTEKVSVTTAEELARGFYRQLRQHGEADRALVEACAGLAGRDEVTVPVLYSRLEGRPLFSGTEDQGLTERIPFMAGDKPEGFVPRPAELDQLVADLLDEDDAPRAVTVGLHGFGGYGKTTLARVICHDERVLRAFSDGVLWVTLGEKPSEADLVGQIRDLITTLTGSPSPDFARLDAARTRLIEELGERQILLVVDDVWNEADLRPFLEGGPRCARLVTTRMITTLPPDTLTVYVGAMQPAEAAAMLGAGVPASDAAVFSRLAARLGEWPLLLKLVNGTLRHRIDILKQALPDALVYVDKHLERRGLTSFDARDPVARDQAVAKTVGVSLELLTEDERARYGELAIFPKAVDVPLPAVEKLWGATGGLDELDTEDLCDRLFRLSLLLAYNPVRETIRLYDVLVDYLVGVEKARLPALHERFLASYGLARWQDLPADEPYLWDHLAYHMVEAEMRKELYALIDKPWMDAQFERTLSHRSFARDIDIAIAAAAAAEPPNLVQLARGCLLYGTLVTKIPIELLGVLAQLGYANKAMGYASLVHEPYLRGLAYQNIGAALLARDDSKTAMLALKYARASAETITIPGWKTKVLSGVVKVLLKSGEEETAIELCDQLISYFQTIKDVKDKVDALEGVLVGLEEAGLCDEAKGVVEQVLIAIEPLEGAQERAEASVRIARAMAGAGLANQALAIAKSIEIPRYQGEALKFVTGALAESNTLDEALGIAESIADPNYRKGALQIVSRALAQSGAWDQALALAESPEDTLDRAWALVNVSRVIVAAGDRTRAGQTLKRVADLIEMADDTLETSERLDVISACHRIMLYGFAIDLALQGTAEATRELLLLDPELLTEVVQTLVQRSEPVIAARIADVALVITQARLDPRSKAKAFVRIANTLARLGEQDKAAEIAWQVVELTQTMPGRAKVLVEVVSILGGAGRQAEAVDVAMQVMDELFPEHERLVPVPPEFQTEVLASLALVLVQAGERDKGVELCTLVSKRVETWKDSWTKAEVEVRIAQALAQAGRVDEALALAESIQQSGFVEPGFHEPATMIQVPEWRQNRERARGDIFAEVCAGLSQAAPHGRTDVFNELRRQAANIGAIDQGATLWQVYQAIQEVDAWWGAG